MKPAEILPFLRTRSPQFWGIVALVVMTLIALIVLPVMRNRETREIEATVADASTVLVHALQNPTIFDGAQGADRDALIADAKQLSLLHDRLVLSHYYLAHSALLAALEYTDYTSRIGIKLIQVGDAQQAALAAMAQYDQSVTQLKASSLSNRVGIQQAVNEGAPKARDATELAYQECELLGSLTRQFGVAQTMALQHLRSLGPDVLAAVGSLKSPLVAATEHAAAQRKRFNPVAR